ncbi:MAG: hypothetical protein J6U93_08190 [Alistipes sp.]|nr:hypothetical protein [Alistipes sp.]
MSRKVYFHELLEECAIKESAVTTGKLQFLFTGREVAIMPTDRYEPTHPRNTLCCGLILNIEGLDPFTAELNGYKMSLNRTTIRYTPKEYNIPIDWLKCNSLDWNRSIVYYDYFGNTTQYELWIDVNGEFDLSKLEYNCLYPISVQVGGKKYKFNKPILVGVNYDGRTYQMYRKLRTVDSGWEFSKLNVSYENAKDVKENM